ncbi:MAG: right-handed parallel beta-helix repeat-containing protein [Myxococcota bacterium]
MFRRTGFVLALAALTTLFACGRANADGSRDGPSPLAPTDGRGDPGGHPGGGPPDGSGGESACAGGETTPPLPSQGVPTVLDACIPEGATDTLVVRLDRAVTVESADGFRLGGGAVQIASLEGEGGPAELTFSLTDHVLPDDRFTLHFWPELGRVVTEDASLALIDGQAVVNQATAYHGPGTLFYVAAAGDDDASGRSPAEAFATPARALEALSPGDYALLQRGDRWVLPARAKGPFRGHLEFPAGGQAGAYITLAAYGEGPRPRLEAPSGGNATIAVRNRSFVALDNLHVVADRGDYGVVFAGDAEAPVVSNCLVEARDGDGGFGGIYYGATLVEGEHVVAPVVRFNEIAGFKTNVSSNGYDMPSGAGRHRVIGGLIEGNAIRDVALPDGHDGLKVARGDYEGIVVRKNLITGWLDDGLETFGARDVVVELNELHSPRPPNEDLIGTNANHASQGIKAGGIDSQRGYTGREVIVRYNYVHDLPHETARSNGIMGNGGKSGSIYGNLVVDVRGIGIKIDCQGCDEAGWDVHHNTVVGAGEDGLQVYTNGAFDERVRIFNNLLDGQRRDLHASVGSGQAIGGHNLLAHGMPSGDFAGDNDATANFADLFVNLETRDLRLAPGAAAVDAGRPLEAYHVDFSGAPVGDAPDVGAREYDAP